MVEGNVPVLEPPIAVTIIEKLKINGSAIFVLYVMTFPDTESFDVSWFESVYDNNPQSGFENRNAGITDNVFERVGLLFT